MDRMTLREAAERTSRSITTLRRYIRSGRLRADKRFGRFGPEYYVSDEGLRDAGLELDAPAERASSPPALRDSRGTSPSTTRAALERGYPDSVPTPLFQELQMKHEQLLVQYGMIRASGLRVLDLQGDLDARTRQTESLRRELSETRGALRRENETLRRELHEARLELEGRALEIDALLEKVRGLEMLTRNQSTSEGIEKQFSDVMDQARRVEELSRPREWKAPRTGGWPLGSPPESTDH